MYQRIPVEYSNVAVFHLYKSYKDRPEVGSKWGWHHFYKHICIKSSCLNNPRIINIGTAVPQHRISQNEHHKILETANGLSRENKLLLHRIYSRSGIQSRYSVLSEFGSPEPAVDEGENYLFHPSSRKAPASVSKRMQLFDDYAIDLCNEAALSCFKQIESFELSSVTHLITFTCTGLSAPGLDIQLVNKLGLNRNTERTCINFMGCYAGINALKSAWHICRSQPDAVVLLCGVELCTLHYREFETQDQLIANALFADGAAVVVVSSKEMKTDKVQLSLNSFYSEFEPAGNDDMVWRVTEFGFDLRLSNYVPDLIKENIKALIDKLFVKSGLTKNEIDYYAIHPGGVKILEACELALGIEKKENLNAYEVLRDYGNMSSVTIFFVLMKYLQSMNESDNGKNILSCAFGPGLTVESMILTVEKEF